MPIPPDALVFVALVVLAGYLIFGITGFGASPITILLASRALWISAALLLPVAWIGVWMGNRVHLRLAPATAARIIGAVLFLTGAALIARTL